jgi:MarR family transcriptional regulator, transcriptional regulator for hemolysin
MKPHQDFFFHYRTMYRPYINKVNEYLSKHKLYSAQWSILKFINTNGPKTLAEISDYQNVESPTITRAVQKLLELDYVEVVPGKDKRVKKIQLTELGKEISSDVEKTIEQFQLDALEGIDVNKLLEATQVLKAVKENLLK